MKVSLRLITSMQEASYLGVFAAAGGKEALVASYG
jgi:hypothetical protein